MNLVRSLALIEELGTDGHSPLLFLDNQLDTFFCKYRTGASLNALEIDCLFYEIVAKNLLDYLGVPTPELSIVEIVAGSYSKKMLLKHKRFCVPGQLYLGSKLIPEAHDLHGLLSLTNKRAFKKIINPYDLLKIAMFDLWIDNCDRGKNENYNILVAQEGPAMKFYAFDHAFCFGGLTSLRIFNSAHPISTNNKLITSAYFRKLLPYLDKALSIEIVNSLLPLQTHEIESIILTSYSQCPPEWSIPEQLKDRMVSFLTAENRISEIKNLMWAMFL